MTTVRKIVEEKAETKVHTIAADATVLDALQVMNEANTGAVLVTENEKIIGIFTERDYAREGEVKGKFAKDTIVRDVMTSQMVMIKLETTLQECAELMRQYRVRHLPVLDNDRVVGMVSIRRLAEALLQEQKGTIVELENYILGTGYGE
ncbi:MAG TPA: CBS domain-containing protein [Anaerolineales bacterium]|nr:CBS domain-containing protein [Anaerolineales bacterium]HMV96073.1 CBS domain-containing protein [Anaerolineales bacterium]HMX19874.1 CBS domain-containing protein [Anaerolineales bacterium]HMX75418.1 CBS domain-containing protein [Anaerolineales bacterium]HMZ42726.1 CBS domain-containing protein [Anaerolineales bacterium]